MKMKKLKRGEKGFTLIELLIVIAITGLITVGLTTTIMQVLTMNYRTVNRMTAVRQVQQAGFWVSPDVQMAQNVTTGGSPGVLLTLNWEEWGTNNTHEVIYTLENMPSGESKVLWREHIGADPDSTTKVAEYIDPDPQKTKCEIVVGDLGDELIFTVTAAVGEQSETRIYRIMPRPES